MVKERIRFCEECRKLQGLDIEFRGCAECRYHCGQCRHWRKWECGGTPEIECDYCWNFNQLKAA